MGKPAAIKLCAMLKGGTLPKTKVRSILYVLGQIKDDDCLEVFLEYLSNDDPVVRLMSARGIKDLTVAPPLDKVLPLVGEDSSRIKKFGVEILAKFGQNEEVVNVLRALLKDDNFNVRFEAARVLEELEKER